MPIQHIKIIYFNETIATKSQFLHPSILSSQICQPRRILWTSFFVQWPFFLYMPFCKTFCTSFPTRWVNRVLDVAVGLEAILILPQSRGACGTRIVFCGLYLFSLNILTILSKASDISDKLGWLFITIMEIYSIRSSPLTSADLMVYFFCCS